jgi:transposase InsO family protein
MAKTKKCELFCQKTEYLGHIVTPAGIQCDPKKIDCVQSWPEPQNVREVRSFVGLANYYRRFVPGMSEKVGPLIKLTKKNARFHWDNTTKESFEQVKQALTTSPTLAYPDPDKSFILDVDASADSVGAVLSQVSNENERVVAYHSKALNQAQRNYCTTYRELLALVIALKHFRPYLAYKTFLVRTDHHSLIWLKNFKEAEGMLARWFAVIFTYKFEIQHRPGRKHGNADALSRRPRKKCVNIECSDCQINRQQDRPVVMTITETTGWFGGRSAADLAEKQRDDTDLKSLLDWKESQARPANTKLVGLSRTTLRLLGQWDSLTMKDGVLYRIVLLKSPERQVHQLVVPHILQKEIFSLLHGNVMAGHNGWKKIYDQASRSCYWPNMREDIKRWVQNCKACVLSKKASEQHRAPMGTTQAGYPLERVALDVMGPLPESNGYAYILVIVDYFSKFCEAYPLRRHTARSVADKFVQEFVLRYGVPTYLHSDQGTEFCSELLRSVCELLEVSKTRTTPYRPRSDGLAERMMRTVKAHLTRMTGENPSQWSQKLPYAMAAYRTTVHDTTKCSPNLLFFGREHQMPLQLMYPPPLLHDNRTCPVEYTEYLKDRLATAYDFARRQSKEGLARQKRCYDRKGEIRKFTEGDMVMRFYPPLTYKKFAQPWLGPFRITKRISDTLYEMDCKGYRIPSVTHVDHLISNVPAFNEEATSTAEELVDLEDEGESGPEEEYDIMDTFLCDDDGKLALRCPDRQIMTRSMGLCDPIT